MRICSWVLAGLTLTFGMIGVASAEAVFVKEPDILTVTFDYQDFDCAETTLSIQADRSLYPVTRAACDAIRKEIGPSLPNFKWTVSVFVTNGQVTDVVPGSANAYAQKAIEDWN